MTEPGGSSCSLADPARLDALRRYAVLDTPREEAFDHLVELAADICETPFAVVNLVDADRQWFKAERGFGVRETPLDSSICAQVMLEPGLIEIPDLSEDRRFACNPLITAGPQFRFYAGSPLTTPDGQVLGTLCVLDVRPRRLLPHQRQALHALAQQVVAQLELRLQAQLAVERSSLLEQLTTQMAAAQAHHRFIVDHVRAGIVLHDASGNVVTANDLALQVLGLTADQIHGKTPLDPHWHFVHEDGHPMAVDDYPIVRVLRTGQPVVNLVAGVMLGAGQPPTWVLVNAYPEHDPVGQLRHVMASFVDITALKQAEERLREADRHKDEFLAMLAHELRNPLASVAAAAAVLKRPGLSGDQVTGSAEVIERQVVHLRTLLDDLLDMARVAKGKLLLRKQWVPLQQVLDAAIEMARPAIEQRGHRLQLQQEVTRPVFLDPVRVSQVIGNLLGNAAKYTEPGGRISVHAQLGPQHELVVRVTDTGIGMAPEMLPRVFLLFEQEVDGSERSGGLGIGLALSSAVARLHGGSLTAESAGRGHGSVFTLSLPAAADQPEIGPAL